MGSLLRLLTDAAGIQDNQICRLHSWDFFPAKAIKDTGNALRVGHIHLASNGPDMVFPLGNLHPCSPRALVVVTGEAESGATSSTSSGATGRTFSAGMRSIYK